MKHLISPEQFDQWKEEQLVVVLVALDCTGSLIVESALSKQSELKLLMHAVQIHGNFIPDEEDH